MSYIKLFVVGVIFTLVFIKTKNLVFIVGAHALINNPFSLVQTDFLLPVVALVLMIVISVFWNKMEKEENRFLFKKGLLLEGAQRPELGSKMQV